MHSCLHRFRALFRRQPRRPTRGQSYVELVIVLPVLLIVLLGLVEVVVFAGRYLDVLDLTRQAARFASTHDPFDTLVATDENCSTPNQFDFFYDTACIFSPPAGSAMCTDLNFCNGMNPYVAIDPTRDDVVISIYTVSSNQVSDVWPSGGYWNLSGGNENWKRDCDGNMLNPAPSSPYYTESLVNSMLVSGSVPTKGFVAVEVYYCHEQILNLPFLSQFIQNPMRIHAYTLMPLPAAQPTPTPKP